MATVIAFDEFRSSTIKRLLGASDENEIGNLAQVKFVILRQDIQVYFGVYFCFSGFFLLLSLLLIRNVRKRLGAFLVISGALTLLGLAKFELSSNFIGVIKLREPRSFNYPGDYLSQGILGWLTMIVPILGIFSPLVIALLINKRIIQSR